LGGSVSGPSAICSSASVSLTLNGNLGNVVKWQSCSTSNFSTSVQDTAINTNSLTAANMVSPIFYRAVVANGCGNAYSSVAAISIQNLWRGTNNADWQDPLNWSAGVLPSTICATVTIPSGTTYSPFLGAGSAAINNLNIASGATLCVSNAVLKIAGAITNNGNLEVSNGTLEETK
jgi:hypothetical protein